MTLSARGGRASPSSSVLADSEYVPAQASQAGQHPNAPNLHGDDHQESATGILTLLSVIPHPGRPYTVPALVVVNLVLSVANTGAGLNSHQQAVKRARADKLSEEGGAGLYIGDRTISIRDPAPLSLNMRSMHFLLLRKDIHLDEEQQLPAATQYNRQNSLPLSIPEIDPSRRSKNDKNHPHSAKIYHGLATKN